MTPFVRWDAYTLHGRFPAAGNVSSWDSTGDASNATMTGLGTGIMPTLQYEYGVPHVAFRRSGSTYYAHMKVDASTRPLEMSSECFTFTYAVVVRMSTAVDAIQTGEDFEKVFSCAADIGAGLSAYDAINFGRLRSTNDQAAGFLNENAVSGIYVVNGAASPSITGRWDVYLVRYTQSGTSASFTAYTRAGQTNMPFDSGVTSALRFPRSFTQCTLGRSLPPLINNQLLFGDIREVSNASMHAVPPTHIVLPYRACHGMSGPGPCKRARGAVVHTAQHARRSAWRAAGRLACLLGNRMHPACGVAKAPVRHLAQCVSVPWPRHTGGPA